MSRVYPAGWGKSISIVDKLFVIGLVMLRKYFPKTVSMSNANTKPTFYAYAMAVCIDTGMIMVSGRHSDFYRLFTSFLRAFTCHLLFCLPSADTLLIVEEYECNTFLTVLGRIL